MRGAGCGVRRGAGCGVRGAGGGGGGGWGVWGIEKCPVQLWELLYHLFPH